MRTIALNRSRSAVSTNTQVGSVMLDDYRPDMLGGQPSSQRPVIGPEQIARWPLPGCAVPQRLGFSHDDRHLAYLYAPDGSLHQSLFAVDLADGETRLLVDADVGWLDESALPVQERLLRERTGDTGLGVVDYLWAAAADRLLVPLPNGLFVVDLPEGALRPILNAAHDPVRNPQLSPDGRRCAFVRDGDLWIIDVADLPGAPRRLTTGGNDGIAHGMAEYVARSDLCRYYGYWWSPDGARIVYTEVDERHIPPYPIVHLACDHPAATAPTIETHRYPFAGQRNALVRLGVVDAEGGPTTWIHGPIEDYVARVAWCGADEILVQVLSRDHGTLEVRRFDARTGQGKLQYSEVSPVWVRPDDALRLLPSTAATGEAILSSSERSGFRHLELRSPEGAFIRPLTSGQWAVEALLGVDEQRGLAYFTGTVDGVTQRGVYAVSLVHGEVTRVSEGRGFHDATVSPGATVYVETLSSLDQPPSVSVRRLPERDLVLALPGDPRPDELDLAPPELIQFEARDGTTLHGMVYQPANAPAPGVLQVYGGPLAQLATDSWGPTVDLRAQALRRLGYCVLVVDNRGSARRGLEFEGAISRRLGHLEVSDQVDAVSWAVDRGLMAASRVAVYGWSYGGYMALRCLATAPTVFCAAVAGAPVTSWELYENFYTENYLGRPQDDPAAYSASGVLGQVERLRGRLLIVHGLIDENVHFRHTARLIDELLSAGVDHEVLLLPEERHHIRREASRQMVERRVLAFLADALAPRRD